MSNAAKIIAGLGAGMGGIIRGRRMREEDDFKKLEREEKRKGIEISDQFQNEIKEKMFSQGAEQGPQSGVMPQTEGSGPAGGVSQESLPKYSIPKIEDMRDIYQRYSMLAATNPHAARRIAPALDGMRRIAISEYAKGFDGDVSTVPGSLAYAKYMAKGSAMFGDYMSPEKAIELAKTTKEAEDEGYIDALEAIHAGDVEKAKKIWNSKGNLKGDVIDVKPATFQLGGKTFKTNEVVYRGRDGQEHKINAFAALFNTQALKDQVTMQLAANKSSDSSTPYTGISMGKTTDKLGNESEVKGVLDKRTGKVTPINFSAGGDETPPPAKPQSYNEAFDAYRQQYPDATKEQIDGAIKQYLPGIKIPSASTKSNVVKEGITATPKKTTFKGLQVSIINDGHNVVPDILKDFDNATADLSKNEKIKLLDLMSPYIISRADKGRYNLIRRDYFPNKKAAAR